MRPISRRASGHALARGLALGAAAIVVVLALDSAVSAVLAQNPFGAPRPAEPQASGVVRWLITFGRSEARRS